MTESIDDFLKNWRDELKKTYEEDKKKLESLQEDLTMWETREYILKRMLEVSADDRLKAYILNKDNTLLKSKINEFRQNIENIQQQIQKIQDRFIILKALSSDIFRGFLSGELA